MKILNTNVLRVLFLILLASQFLLSRRFSKRSSRKFHSHAGCVANGGECKKRSLSLEKTCCNGSRCADQGNKKLCIEGKKLWDDTCDKDAECQPIFKCSREIGALLRRRCHEK